MFKKYPDNIFKRQTVRWVCFYVGYFVTTTFLNSNLHLILVIFNYYLLSLNKVSLKKANIIIIFFKKGRNQEIKIKSQKPTGNTGHNVAIVFIF